MDQRFLAVRGVRFLNKVMWATTLMTLALLLACSPRKANSEGQVDQQSLKLVGQLALPGGPGARGVEVIVESIGQNAEPAVTWLQLGVEQRFSQTLDGIPTKVTVVASDLNLYQVEKAELLTLLRSGHLDLGVIDLRKRLIAHRMTVLAADEGQRGDVRMGLFLGPPSVGPFGGSVSLGSRQFSSFTLGSEIEWLVATEATDIHLLVELPIGKERGRNWRSGRQQLFGPYDVKALPTEVVLN